MTETLRGLGITSPYQNVIVDTWFYTSRLSSCIKTSSSRLLSESTTTHLAYAVLGSGHHEAEFMLASSEFLRRIL